MSQLPNELTQYFAELNERTVEAYEIAKKARALGYDPASEPEVKIAKNMAERVVGLVSVMAPQIVGVGIDRRIEQLEAEYSILDWRVAFTIALEVAQQKFCEFKDEREALEVGIRIGFAYVTNGVVSSPLEGFVNLELADRKDGKGKYFRINYAGPVRNAGGTAAATSVLIADYVRKHMGYAQYDPQPDEVSRCYVEIGNYHERVTNLQYFPSEQEMQFLVSNMPIEVSGDPTEKIEVSNYKNLPRIPTNRIRSGYCLIYSSCIPLKAPKLWKQLAKWGNDMGMEQWNFLEEFIKIQKKAQAKGSKSKESGPKLTPNFTYIADLVAGRPVFGHPLKPGGFRLRYGRSRLSGLSGQSLHPATMIIANEFIATASQLKVERPGKAAAYTVCDTIEGPIVRLKSGDVLQVNTAEQARKLSPEVEKVLYLGDVLVNYGDFLDRAHPLIPPGYCEEWWLRELEQKTDVPKEIESDPSSITFEQAVELSQKYDIPFHPKFTFCYKLASIEQLVTLHDLIVKAPKKPQLVFRNRETTKTTLELLGVPHKVVQNEYLVVLGEYAQALRFTFQGVSNATEPLAYVQEVAPVMIRDKAGVFIGARLGRPEKAKMRKLTGSPHTLFPCGAEGGRLRSINESIEVGQVTSSFEIFINEQGEEVVLPMCPITKKPAKKAEDSPKSITIDMRPYVKFCLERMGSRIYPDLIKGVRGTVNEEHATEHLLKGFLRARHEIYVNKDGTVRYDASEVPITHFRPREIGTSIEKIKELGYVTDIHGKPIIQDDQVIEMFPQDVVLPACDDSPDERSDLVLLRTAQFVDELLEQLYGLDPYYNAESVDDLIGHFVVALAPHTSAGTIGRIIGFSQTQGLFYHPYLHCATRRDCDGDEGCVFLLMDAFLNFSKRYLPSSRGGTMDAPIVLTTVLAPAEVDDMVLNVDIAWKYPLEFYEACLEYKMPWEVKIPIIDNVLNKPEQFFGMGFTHDTTDMNDGNLCSAYKTLPTMQDKLQSQMDLAVKLSAVDEKDVARLVIEKHFIRDLKGNLRKFSQQGFRCVSCNEKYRRPPLQGNCRVCGGKVIFTISEGSVVKYLEPCESLVRAYDLDPYLAQSIELTRRRVEEVFGKDPEKQLGLGAWFG